MVAEGAARGDHCPARVLPYTVALVPHLDKSKLGSDGGDGVASCHGSVLVSEQGQGSDCLCMVAVSVGACDPLALYGQGQIDASGLGGGLCLATRPDDAAGGEVRGRGEDHGSVSCDLRVSYRRSGSVPIADVPDAPLSIAVGVAVTNLDCLQALVAGVAVPQGEVGALVAVKPDLICFGQGHGSFRFDAVSLQGQALSGRAPRTPRTLSQPGGRCMPW